MAIIAWLEKQFNYDLITGQAAKGLVVAGKKVKKSDAYKSLAQYVNRACRTDWDHLNAKSRYDAYLMMYFLGGRSQEHQDRRREIGVHVPQFFQDGCPLRRPPKCQPFQLLRS